jgi:hypothetical protein
VNAIKFTPEKTRKPLMNVINEDNPATIDRSTKHLAATHAAL